MWGNTPSSMPIKNTAGYSRPLAECRVISVTLESSSARSSVSATKADRSISSSMVSNSPATPISSSRFSRRPSASMVSCASSSARYPDRSRIREMTPAGPRSRAAASSIMARKSPMPAAARPDTPASAQRRSASVKVIPSAAAKSSSRATEESPTPRLGVLSTRLTLTSSDG